VPDADPAQNPALYVSDLQVANKNNFFPQNFYAQNTVGIVVDPHPDLYVFGHPRSGSLSHKYGSGSFRNQAKVVRKT
jgi:hypothetical protein